MPIGRDYPVRDLREKLGLTQEEFAALVGATARTVGRWERGESKPTRFAIDRMEALDRQGRGRAKKGKAAA